MPAISAIGGMCFQLKKKNPAKLIDIFMFIYYIFGINTVAVWTFWFYIWGQGITIFWCIFLAPCVFIVIYLGARPRERREESPNLRQQSEVDCCRWKSGLDVCLLPLVFLFFPLFTFPAWLEDSILFFSSRRGLTVTTAQLTVCRKSVESFRDEEDFNQMVTHKKGQ